MLPGFDALRPGLVYSMHLAVRDQVIEKLRRGAKIELLHDTAKAKKQPAPGVTN